MNNRNVNSQLGPLIAQLGQENDLGKLNNQRAELDKKIVDLLVKQQSTIAGLQKNLGVSKPQKPAGAPSTAQKVGNVNTGFYADVVSGSKPRLTKGDGAARVGVKIYNVIKNDIEDRRLKAELTKNFQSDNFDSEKRRHDELIAAIKKAKGKPGKAPLPGRDEKGRFIKKPDEAPGVKPPAQAPAPAAAPAPAPAPAPVKPPAPAPAPAPVKPPAPAPAAAPVKPPTATKAPAVTKTLPTAAKVVGIAAVATGEFSQAKADVMRHEGSIPYPYKDSKGLWTIGVGHLIGDGKTLPDIYDSWKNNGAPGNKKNNTTPALSPDKVNSLFEEDFKKHLAIAKRGPGFDKANEVGQSGFINLSFNMGEWWTIFKKAAAAAARGDFETTALELEDSKWYEQVGKRASEVVSMVRNAGNAGASRTDVPVSTGTKLSQDSTENKDLKNKSGQTTIISNNSTTNNIVGGKSTPQVLSTPTPSEKPGILGN